MWNTNSVNESKQVKSNFDKLVNDMKLSKLKLSSQEEEEEESDFAFNVNCFDEKNNCIFFKSSENDILYFSFDSIRSSSQNENSEFSEKTEISNLKKCSKIICHQSFEEKSEILNLLLIEKDARTRMLVMIKQKSIYYFKLEKEFILEANSDQSYLTKNFTAQLLIDFSSETVFSSFEYSQSQIFGEELVIKMKNRNINSFTQSDRETPFYILVKISLNISMRESQEKVNQNLYDSDLINLFELAINQIQNIPIYKKGLNDFWFRNEESEEMIFVIKNKIYMQKFMNQDFNNLTRKVNQSKFNKESHPTVNKPFLIYKNKHEIKKMIFSQNLDFMYIIEKYNRIAKIDSHSGDKVMDYHTEKGEITTMEIDEENGRLYR